MIQRDELLTAGITSNQLTAYENDLTLNLHYRMFDHSRFNYYSFTPNGSSGYATINLPATTVMIRNGVITEIEEDETSLAINHDITPSSIDPCDVEDFLFTWFGNKILVDNGSNAERTTMVAQTVDTSISKLSVDIKRDYYSLIKAMYMQDTAMMFSMLQKLSKNTQNKMKENTEVKVKGIKRRRINLKGYTL